LYFDFAAPLPPKQLIFELKDEILIINWMFETPEINWFTYLYIRCKSDQNYTAVSIWWVVNFHRPGRKTVCQLIANYFLIRLLLKYTGILVYLKSDFLRFVSTVSQHFMKKCQPELEMHYNIAKTFVKNLNLIMTKFNWVISTFLWCVIVCVRVCVIMPHIISGIGNLYKSFINI